MSMMRYKTVIGNIAIALTCLTLLAGFGGCKSKPLDRSAFSDESQYVVESIVSDIAEQMFYAVNHQLPDKRYFQVLAIEETNSPLDVPVYELQIRLDPKQSALHLKINVNGPIWSPTVYKDAGNALAAWVKLKAGSVKVTGDT